MGKSGKRPPVKSSLFERNLRNRIQDTYGSSPLSVDQLVHRLRAKFSEYRRHKYHMFTKMVKQTLDSDPTYTKQQQYSNDDNDDVMSAKKRMRKVDGSEIRVVRRRMESGSNSGSGAEDDVSVVSTSEEDDVVYNLKFEPEFDLTKTMLRNKYGGTKKDTNYSKMGEKGKNVELEVVNNNSNKKVELIKKSDKELGYEENVDDGPRFKDLGGMEEVLDELTMEVFVPLLHPELRRVGMRPMSGILLHGPPGCGKTKLAHAIANETGVPFYKVSATELVTGISGASEENIRELFSKAYRTAPSIIFIDEIDAIASKRENLQREMERRIVTQLMTCMEASHKVAKPDDNSKHTAMSGGKLGHVLVIAATNRADAIDPALRRPGRFDKEISLGVPDENARVHILSVLINNRKLEGAFDLVKLSRATPGFVGADLSALVDKAVYLAVKRIFDGRKLQLLEEGSDTEEKENWWRKALTTEEIEKLSITMSDFEAAAKLVQPSSKREGFSSIPNVTWEDIGGLDSLRNEFERHIIRRIKYPDQYKEYGLELETGFLLYGPPGCGKTSIAKAVANEAGASFIHIKGPELLSKYVGEGESSVRSLFSRARTCSPCILFFDEVDALTTKRGQEGGWVVAGLLNQLMVELDGADQRKGVYVIGATNRPEVMDPALRRPGRFGKPMYVPLPNQDERVAILKVISKKMPLDDDVDLIAIAEDCEGFSGADLKALMYEAALIALDEKLSKINAVKAATAAREGTSVSSSLLSPSEWSSIPHNIKPVHIEQALGIISPSISDEQKQHFHLLQQSFK